VDLSCDCRVPPSALWSMTLSTLLVNSLYSPNTKTNDNKNSFGSSFEKRQKVEFCGSIIDEMELMAHAGVVASGFWSRLGICPLVELTCKRTLRQGGIFISLDLIDCVCSLISEIWSKSEENGSMITLAHVMHSLVGASNLHTERINLKNQICKANRLLVESRGVFLSCNDAQCEPRMIASSLHLIHLRQILYTTSGSDERTGTALLQLSQMLVNEQSGYKNRFLYADAMVLRSFVLIFFGNQSQKYCVNGVGTNVAFESERKILRVIADIHFSRHDISKCVSSLHAALNFSTQTYAPFCDASLSIISNFLACCPMSLLLEA